MPLIYTVGNISPFLPSKFLLPFEPQVPKASKKTPVIHLWHVFFHPANYAPWKHTMKQEVISNLKTVGKDSSGLSQLESGYSLDMLGTLLFITYGLTNTFLSTGNIKEEISGSLFLPTFPVERRHATYQLLIV